ncbi:MAG: haloacid dehalogenase, partial [Burkholderiales bacterium]|nr:haloacid dehalogenase [Anaerolineae bacterium]
MAEELIQIADSIRAAFTAKSASRDRAIATSRELIRSCAESIRAIHRQDWDTVEVKLDLVREGVADIRRAVSEYPDLYYQGYTQDALKEVVEAFATYAIVRGHPLPSPQDLDVENDTYLNGLAEAATELRRFILDLLRREEDNSEAAERLLNYMDAIYDQLITFDFPDAITGGLRRHTDIVRGVLERTRGDLTNSVRQRRLQVALQDYQENAFREVEALNRSGSLSEQADLPFS